MWCEMTARDIAHHKPVSSTWGFDSVVTDAGVSRQGTSRNCTLKPTHKAFRVGYSGLGSGEIPDSSFSGTIHTPHDNSAFGVTEARNCASQMSAVVVVKPRSGPAIRRPLEVQEQLFGLSICD